jgi:carboxypeptidase C (cathepsin A)
MRREIVSCIFCIAGLVFSVTATLGEEIRAAPERPPAPEAQAAHLPRDSITQHSVSIGGRQLAYKATAGTLPLLNAKGEVSAQVFYSAYVAENSGKRPLTFAFNGGPGASGAFLHLAALGPKILPFNDNGSQPVLPVRFEDNQASWLSFTDLVFIDPVGTGYSRATHEADAGKEFWGVDKDADSIADFIRIYLARAGRGLDPVFLAGESYGGFRSALLADRLLGMGIQVKGTIMISPALDFSMLHGNAYTILPTSFALPSLTAANVEMRDGPAAPLDLVHEAEGYARTAYLLHLSDAIKRDDAATAALARFTGLDPDIVARHHGRITASLFVREYQRRTDRALSRYDATVSVPLPQPSERDRFDPILDGAIAILGPAAVTYFDKELQFRSDLDYRTLNREIGDHWDFGTKPSQQGYAGSLDELQKARTRNPALAIMIAHGYTDLVTPYAMSAYLVAQLDPIETAAPIQMHVYRGGHMMYLRPASRAELGKDAQRFYEDALK